MATLSGPTGDLQEALRAAGIEVGCSAEFSVRIGDISFASGETVTPPPGGVLAIVGGNNVGKSVTLRQINASLRGDNVIMNGPVTEIRVDRGGSSADLTAWLTEHIAVSRSHDGFVFSGSGTGGLDGVQVSQVGGLWHGGWVGNLSGLIVFSAEANGRFEGAGAANARATAADPAMHPFHFLQDDHRMMKRVSDIANEYFGSHLTLDSTGSALTMRLGIPNLEPPSVTESTREWALALSALPSLHEQGDGMRAFFSLIFPLLTGRALIVIVDEPEAFLHPPQARGLGRLLGTLAAERSAQVILATHSEDVLLGALSSNAPLTVARLRRDTGSSETSVKVLQCDRLQEIHKDPVAHTMRMLESLFYRAVVLVEGDQDALFYRAALEAYVDYLGADPRWLHEVMFMPTHGKQAIAKAKKLLEDLGTPVVSVADIDLLRASEDFLALADAHGMDLVAAKSLRKRATSQFDQPDARLSVEKLRSQIETALRDEAASAPELRERVRDVVKTKDPWKPVKDGGVQMFSGDSAKALDALLAACSLAGLLLVPVGTLERFCTSTPKGRGWIRTALASGAHKGQNAQSFAAQLYECLRRTWRIDAPVATDAADDLDRGPCS